MADDEAILCLLAVITGACIPPAVRIDLGALSSTRRRAPSPPLESIVRHPLRLSIGARKRASFRPPPRTTLTCMVTVASTSFVRVVLRIRGPLRGCRRGMWRGDKKAPSYPRPAAHASQPRRDILIILHGADGGNHALEDLVAVPLRLNPRLLAALA